MNHLQLAIAEIDGKISQLQQTRQLMVQAAGQSTGTVRRGRQPGVKGRVMSDEARAKIREAQQKRWAAAKAAKQGAAPAEIPAKKGKKAAAGGTAPKA